MEGYELGKDIQEIKERLRRLEELVGFAPKKPCDKKITASSASEKSGIHTLEERPDEKVFTIGRMDAGECECREQTLSIYPDGRYKHVAVHHNHSNWHDDGDTHRLTIHVRAGDSIVETLGSERFVPRGKDRTKDIEGQSEEIKRRYSEIDQFSSTLECD